MHRHATDLENLLAAQKYERDECMGIDLSQWTRDAGMESAGDSADDHFTAEDWSWVIYFVAVAAVSGTLVYLLYPAFVGLYNSIFN